MSVSKPHQAASRTLPAELECLLLRAAESFAPQIEIQGLVEELSSIVLTLPHVRFAGLGIHDDERQLFTLHAGDQGRAAFGPSLPGVVWESVPVDESDIPRLQSSGDLPVTTDVPADGRTSFHARLFSAGVRRYVSVPIRLEGVLLGAILVGFAEPLSLPSELAQLLQRLGRLILPGLRSCFVNARLSRGDRRRDTLIAIYHGINRSLQPEAVLNIAREVIGRFEGHCLSEINLLEDGGARYRCYRRHTPANAAPRSPQDPEVLPTLDSVLAWVLEQRRTFESDDLAQRPRFSGDGALLRLGVRRYVAAPMFARDRIIGAFVFGTTEPHPPLRMDVWLYENIASQLGLAIDNALQHDQVQLLSQRLNEQTIYLQEEIRNEHNLEGMIGRSAAIQRVRDAIRRVAGNTTTVLITGETGVGKELVARAIHEQSSRAGQPMVKVNCAAIPESMVESELFGHERGAFTSAVERRIGRFELARDSTLFLDEIGELSLAVQAKLLRVLQDGEFERVGGARTITSNARVVVATNRDLPRAVQAGTFRSDLFYRVNVFPIFVPPLRERREDIRLLVEAFIAQLGRRMGKSVATVEPALLEELSQRDWPGNVRELRSTIERAIILCDGRVLDARALESHGIQPAPPPMPAPAPPLRLAPLKHAEAQHIRAALEQTCGVVEGPLGAAALLGMNPSTLRYRMKCHGIQRAAASGSVRRRLSGERAGDSRDVPDRSAG